MSDTDETQDAPNTDEAKDKNVSVSAASDGREVVYVRAPVSPAVKKAIISKGFRILSAQFAPEDEPVFNGMTGKLEDAVEDDPDTDDDEDVEPQPKPKAKPRSKKA